MKHTLEEIRREYDRLDHLLGLDTTAVALEISDRLVSRYGLCRLMQTGGKILPVKIIIAAFLLEEEDAFWDTIRHEYAHAAASLRTGRRHGHDALWKELCAQVGARTNTRAEECAGHQKKRAESVRYVARCLQCGAVFERMRRTKFITAVEKSRTGATRYICRCGGNIFSLQKTR